MIRFKNEQYLPCTVPQIEYKSERRAIPDQNAPLYLKEDVFVYPMNAGYLIENSGGEYFVESIDLLRSIHGKSAYELCDSDKEYEEVEQYYYHELVGFDETAVPKIVVQELDRKYSALYADAETTWFSYVPLKLEVDITNRCNLECTHCSREASSRATAGKLSLQNYVDLFQQAGSIGIPELSLMGGEPTFNPSFIELATVARLSGIRTLFTSTNGWLIDEDLAERMAILFDSIQVSIHGANAETHDAIVGKPGAFSRACRTVRLLREHGVPSLNISCTVMNRNADQLDAMLELARDLGASSIRFLSLFSKGRGRRLDQLKTEDKARVSEKIRAFRETAYRHIRIEGGGFPNYSAVSKDATIYGCPAGRSLMYVDADGDVSACGNLNPTLGNVSDAPLMDLWHSPAMMKLRKKPACACPYTDLCAGGCLANEHWRSMFDVDTTPIN